MTDQDSPFCNVVDSNQAKLTAHVKAGGCAAKISAAELAQIVSGLPSFSTPNLLTSIDSFEDAAVYKISDELALVQTIDFFPPVVDDPFLFGQIAATNALSDIYAMGGTPVTAMAVLIFPTCDFPLAVAQQIVAAGAAAVEDAGASLVGGHSIQGPEPVFGLSVTGFIHPQKILTNGGARDRDALVLTKPIGTGASLLAFKGAILSEAASRTLFSTLIQSNGKALAIAQEFAIHAATDVTGFGLIGHAHEMAKASALSVRIEASAVPLLDEALSFAEQGLVPAGAYANRKSYERFSYIKDDIDLAVTDLLYDPQTSGGLLLAVPQEFAAALAQALNAAGLTGKIIGSFVAGQPGQVEVTNGGPDKTRS